MKIHFAQTRECLLSRGLCGGSRANQQVLWREAAWCLQMGLLLLGDRRHELWGLVHFDMHVDLPQCIQAHLLCAHSQTAGRVYVQLYVVSLTAFHVCASLTPIILTPETEVNHNNNCAFEINGCKFLEWKVMKDLSSICRNVRDERLLINMSESSCDFC